MSARIAPDPISAAISTAPDFRSRTMTGDSQLLAAGHHSGNLGTDEPAAPENRAADILPPLPPPPDPPGTAYVVAVLSGALSPRPTSMQEVLLRTGKDWSPPDSPYRLADKTI
ncbi:MAG: hypothetical protein Q8L54_07415 [Devosia sp.]|nr:hypothetical protein [Devosia sp.]